jgi:hypothetical protein
MVEGEVPDGISPSGRLIAKQKGSACAWCLSDPWTPKGMMESS